MRFSFGLEQNTIYISLQRHIPILFDGLKLNQEECYLISEKGKKEGINRHLINSWFSLCDVGGPPGKLLGEHRARVPSLPGTGLNT